MLKVKVRQPNWKQAIESLVPTTIGTVVTVLDEVGKEMVDWLESLTEAERGWIARRGGAGLAGGYRYAVAKTETGARLVIRNTVFYSIILEQRDGLFVLSGIMDPGGKVEQKLVEVCAKYGMRFTRSQ